MRGAQQQNQIMTEHSGGRGLRFGEAKVPEKYVVEPDMTPTNPLLGELSILGQWAVGQGETLPPRSSSTDVPSTPERTGQRDWHFPTNPEKEEFQRPADHLDTYSASLVGRRPWPAKDRVVRAAGAGYEKPLAPGDREII